MAFDKNVSAAAPTAEEELWRYTRIDKIDLDRYELASTTSIAQIDSLIPKVESVITITTAGGLLLNIDGEAAKVKVSQESVAEQPSDDYFYQLNAKHSPKAVVIDVAAGATIAEPIAIFHVVDGNTIAFPRTVVRAGEGSQVSICEYLISTESADAFLAPVTEINAGKASNVSFVSVQLLNPQSNCVAYQLSSVERDATFRSSAVALGGDYARVRTDSRLVGQGATSQLDAVYFGSGNQQHDFRTIQDHRAPKTTSDLLFKGVVADRAHSVYTGLIRVEKGAAGTNAYQTNRNLVLSEGARADSVPNLEIEENDVRCSHASAVGPVDEEQRYYLESRGVPTAVAERLIVAGFIDEMITRLPIKAIQDSVRAETRTRLSAFLNRTSAQ